MDNEPLAAGERVHTRAAEERAESASHTFEDLLGDSPEPVFEEQMSATPVAPSGERSATIEIAEATEIAANALITMYCQVNPAGEPNMQLTGSVRLAILEIAKVLGGTGVNFKPAIASLLAIDDHFDL